ALRLLWSTGPTMVEHEGNVAGLSILDKDFKQLLADLDMTPRNYGVANHLRVEHEKLFRRKRPLREPVDLRKLFLGRNTEDRLLISFLIHESVSLLRLATPLLQPVDHSCIGCLLTLGNLCTRQTGLRIRSRVVSHMRRAVDDITIQQFDVLEIARVISDL